MSLIDENMAEQAALDWFEELGYARVFGPDIAPGGPQQERESYKQVVPADRFMTALVRLNPHIPAAVLEDASRQVIHGNAAGLMQANRQFHRWLTDGVPVEINKDGETLGDFVALIDFANPDNNEWLAVNQYSIRRPQAHPPPRHRGVRERPAPGRHRTEEPRH